MYGVFSYIYHKNEPNVGKYTIFHGSYGLWKSTHTQLAPWPLDDAEAWHGDGVAKDEFSALECSELRNEVYFDENKFCFKGIYRL